MRRNNFGKAKKYSGSIPTYINPYDLSSSDNRQEGWIRFPSRAESKCYVMLRRLFDGCEVICQHKLRVSARDYWKVDFKVVAKSRIGIKQISRLYKLDLKCVNTVYVEWKSVFDDNFRLKLSKLTEYDVLTCDKLLILSDNPGAVVWEDLTMMKVYYKLVYSKRYLEKIVNGY